MAESIEPKAAAPPVFPTFDRIFFGGERVRWRKAIDNSGLPAPLMQLVYGVVKRTRLWRVEKRTVALELIAHFHDGLAAGESPESLITRFGNEHTAARLIRRGKRRNRPLIWHAWKYLVRGVLILIGIYALVLVRFFMLHPTVKVDYIAQLNEPVLATAEQDRAWPIYRQALLSLGLEGPKADKTFEQIVDKDADGVDQYLMDLKPTDAQWPAAKKWLDAHQQGIALIRQGSTKPNFGFVLGPNGSQNDAELGWQHPPTATYSIDVPMIAVLLPALNDSRQLAEVLRLDLRDAVATNDSQRAAADLNAMLDMAGQLRDPIVITRLVAIGIDALCFSEVERILAHQPRVLSDEQWIALVHRISRIGGDTAGSLIDLAGERMFMYDLIQRSYSDNGHGDGILTAEGARLWPMVMHPPTNTRDPDQERIQLVATMAVSGALSTVSSRKALLSEYDRLMNLMTESFSQPLRNINDQYDPFAQYSRRLTEIRSSPALLMQFLPIAILMPALNRAAWTAERLLGTREGLEVGIALELYRRHHGSFPDSLSALGPVLLPAIPADRITGDPVKYRLIDGHPVVYSVGADRKDDGGRAALLKNGKPAAAEAAKWGSTSDPTPDGDWILYDARPEIPATQPAR